MAQSEKIMVMSVMSSFTFDHQHYIYSICIIAFKWLMNQT